MNKTNIIPILKEFTGQREIGCHPHGRTEALRWGPYPGLGSHSKGHRKEMFELGLSGYLGVCQAFRVGKSILTEEMAHLETIELGRNKPPTYVP